MTGNITQFLNERRELENITKNLSIFSKKNERITELKIHFHKQLDKAILNKDIQKAQTYYFALYRAVKLSQSVYKNILKTIEENFKSMNFEEPNRLEIDYFFQAIEEIEKNSQKDSEIRIREINKIKEDKLQFLSFQNEMIKFVENFKQRIFNLTSNNKSNIIILERKIEEERIILEKLNQQNTIFEEMELERRLEKLEFEEKNLEKNILDEISEIQKNAQKMLNKEIENFKNQTSIFNKIKEYLSRDYSETKNDLSRHYQILLEKGEILEKHASIFAAVVVGLSSATLIASFAGLGPAVAVFSGAFHIIATTGEALQALPFVDKKIIPKIENLFQ